MNKNEVNFGDELRLRRGDEERVVEVTDFPGDASVITLEPSLTDDPEAIICGIEESEDVREAPIQVGWHVTTFDGSAPWEIVEIIRK